MYWLKLRIIVLTILSLALSGLSIHTGTMQNNFAFFVPPQWSHDGSRVAVVDGRTIMIYDATSGALVHRLEGHTDFVSEVAWSPDSSMLATSSSDQTVKLWSAEGDSLRTLTGHGTSVTTVTWSPDGARILSWGFDTRPNLFVWDAFTGVLLQQHNSGDIVVAIFSSDGQRLTLSTSLGIGTINAQTFEVISGSPRAMCCANQMYTLAWSPDGNTLVTGSINGLVTLWDANTGQILNQFVANPEYEPDSREVDDLRLSWVHDVAFTPDGSTVLSASGDGTLRAWNASTGDLVQETQVSPLYTAAWSPYSGRLAVLEPSPGEVSALSSEQEFDASDVSGTLSIVVPTPSLERLQSIADACNVLTSVEQALTTSIQSDQLADFVTEVEALAENTIPLGCEADLVAVAEAIAAQ